VAVWSVSTWLAAPGIEIVCLFWPIRENNVFGVTAIAFATAVLLLATCGRTEGSTNWCARTSATFEGFGR
jgi:hypothetical protein